MIVALWGDEKTGKTSFALSFPKDLRYFEFDFGGFDRAARRFKVDLPKICRSVYPVPPHEGKADKYKPLTGFKELYYQFLQDYNNACMSKNGFRTLVMDTCTMFWELDRLAYLQELQDKQVAEKDGKVLRTSLMPVEYAEPNARMRGVLYYARSSGKDLVLVNHSRDEYKSQLNSVTGRMEDIRTGRTEIAGWNYLYKECDVVVKMTSGKNYIPVATIDDRVACGLALEMTGQELPEPTYNGLRQLMELFL